MSHVRTPGHDESATRDDGLSRSARLYAGSAVIALAGATITGVLGVTTASAATPAAAAGATTAANTTVSRQVDVATSDDSFVNSSQPKRNYGHNARLLAGSAPHHHLVSYLKFTIPAAARGHITSAEVVLGRTGHHLSGRIVLRAVDNHWNESTLTSVNAPKAKARLGRKSTNAASAGVTFPVQPASLNNRNKVSFTVSSKSTSDTAQFVSSNAKGGPRLVLTYSRTAAAHATPVAHPAVASSKYATLGLAVPGGNPSEFKAAADADLHSTWSRLYFNGSVPASLNAWPDAKAAASAGTKLWLSLALNVADLEAGRYDAALSAFVRTLPAGTRVTTNHEPSNKSKGISPAAFAGAYNHAARVIIDASGGRVLPGPIEVQANVVHKGYLDGLNPALVSFVGLDGYDGIGGAQNANRSFAQVSGAAFAYSRKLFPHAAIGFAEFNSSRTAGWTKWVADTLIWCKSVGADTAVLFTSLDYWRKTPAQLHALAGVLNK